MTKILVLEKPEEKLRRERERLLGELSVYGERLAVLQDTIDEIKEMIEYYDGAIDNAFDFIRKHENKERVSLLERLTYSGFEYIAKDINDELWAYEDRPNKYDVQWAVSGGDNFKVRGGKNYPEVQWSDEEPTKIADLLEIYQNGGENGKVEAE